MRDGEQRVHEAGATVAAIGTGDRAYAKAFKEERDIAFPLLVDDKRVSFRAVGARRSSLWKLATPGIVAAGVTAAAKGQMQGRTGPAPLLLGATHVITPDGEVPYAWVNGDAADDAPLDDVLAALDALGPP